MRRACPSPGPPRRTSPGRRRPPACARTRIVHAQHHACDLESRIDRLAHQPHRLKLLRPRPGAARKWACIGMSTSRATARPFSVSRPRDGGQSSRMNSYRSLTLARFRSRRLAVWGVAQLSLDRREVSSAWQQGQVLARPLDDRGDVGLLIHQHVIDGRFQRARVDAQVEGGVGLGVQVRCQPGSGARLASGASFIVVVVLPTPPFWFMRAISRTGRDRWSQFGH